MKLLMQQPANPDQNEIAGMSDKKLAESVNAKSRRPSTLNMSGNSMTKLKTMIKPDVENDADKSLRRKKKDKKKKRMDS